MDIAAFEEQLKGGALAKKISVFAGREDFLKERMFEKAILALVRPDERSENVFRIDFSLADAEDFIDKTTGFCFSEDPRLFYLSNFDSLTVANRKSVYSTILSPYFAQDIHVFIGVTAQPVTAESVKALSESAEKIDFWAPFANQMPGWVQKSAAEFGARITPGATDLLLHKTGDDLRLIYQELRKLAITVGKNGIIEEKIVAANVSYIREESIFDLLNAIGRRELGSALEIIENITDKGEPVQKTWFMIQKTLRDYRLFHDLCFDRPDLFSEVVSSMKKILALSGKSDFKSNSEKKNLVTAIQTAASEWPDLIKETMAFGAPNAVSNMAFAINYRHSELREIWPKILEMDAALKTSIPSHLLALQEFLVDLINPVMKTGKKTGSMGFN
ncbi:MAG: DNA polymerase III subunit delta [Candidatus Riflebacteria bacterium]|nr:DNA polymerase III subunit delta [Candidatus Riflebacteria bacterium]